MQVIEAQCPWSWSLTITSISARSGRSAEAGSPTPVTAGPGGDRQFGSRVGGSGGEAVGRGRDQPASGTLPFHVARSDAGFAVKRRGRVFWWFWLVRCSLEPGRAGWPVQQESTATGADLTGLVRTLWDGDLRRRIAADVLPADGMQEVRGSNPLSSTGQKDNSKTGHQVQQESTAAATGRDAVQVFGSGSICRRQGRRLAGVRGSAAPR